MAVIEVQHLTRQFTSHVKQSGFLGAVRGFVRRQFVTKTATDDLCFRIEPGEFVGFLGPNGAGKTTTLKMLSGVLHPTTGTATVLGHVPWRREPALQKRFALVLGQKNQLWWDLPAYDSFLLNRHIYDIPQVQFERKVAELQELLQLEGLLQVPVRKLSLGERMKCELVASLLHSPEILFLDEPTIGLDVVSQSRIRDFLRLYNQQFGTTVLLTSHYMGDIEALCKRVLVIDQGRIVYDGELRGLARSVVDKRRVRLSLLRPVTGADLDLVTATGQDAAEVTVDGHSLSLLVPRDRLPATMAALLGGLPVDDLAVEEVEIEHVIRQLFDPQRAQP